ncbi:hypothetical protein L207DRAFT_326155 [Hyaloscypha variabilis F]|uniref:Uncharacterized protein n=1 Tax=Hyaloscypha variabilis (strain UAMH 11265 / GT02V1 / F) TaxID=1149755 RepID=A0A2J6RSI9_HYAVF|nr:hypothetical protein L207DRAFT_326155 [Hyaloscypha variabilis F]
MQEERTVAFPIPRGRSLICQESRSGEERGGDLYAGGVVPSDTSYSPPSPAAHWRARTNSSRDTEYGGAAAPFGKTRTSGTPLLCWSALHKHSGQIQTTQQHRVPKLPSTSKPLCVFPRPAMERWQGHFRGACRLHACPQAGCARQPLKAKGLSLCPLSRLATGVRADLARRSVWPVLGAGP